MLTGIEAIDQFIMGLGFIFLFILILGIIFFFIYLRDSIDEINTKLDKLIKHRK